MHPVYILLLYLYFLYLIFCFCICIFLFIVALILWLEILLAGDFLIINFCMDGRYHSGKSPDLQKSSLEKTWKKSDLTQTQRK